MLQGAAYSSPPLYGHSHYKKFWLKKMQTEDDRAVADPFRAPPPESFSGGIFWKHANDVNCSRLEMKGTSRPSFEVPARRSDSREMFLSNFAQESHNERERENFDCALSIGMQTPCEAEEENYAATALHKKSSGIHKFRLQSLRRLLQTDSDSQITVNRVEKTTEAEFSDGSVTRTCSDCKTDKTPLWRNGPNGPKSLCNACGIRYKKIAKQRSASNTDGEGDVGHKKTPTKLSSVRQMKLLKRKRDTAELRPCDTAAPRKKNSATFMAAAAPPATVVLPTNRGLSNDERRSSTNSFLSGSFAEDEEEGAVLLMGLSCGLVNA